jgi:hypothetical protein
VPSVSVKLQGVGPSSLSGAAQTSTPSIGSAVEASVTVPEIEPVAARAAVGANDARQSRAMSVAATAPTVPNPIEVL